MRQEQPQKLKFLKGQRDAFAIGCDRVLVQVHAQSARFENSLCLGGRAAAEHRLDARDHLHHAEGLDQIVVRPEVKALDFVIFHAPCRRHNDGDLRRFRLGAQKAQKRYTVLPGQHHIQKHKLRLFLPQCRAECIRVGKAPRVKAGRAERVDLDITDTGVILHTPDHAHPSSLCTPVTENTTHSAMFTAWSPMRSKYFAIIRRSSAYSPSSGVLARSPMSAVLTFRK